MAAPLPERHLYTQSGLLRFGHTCGCCGKGIAGAANPAARCVFCSLCGRAAHVSCADADCSACPQQAREQRLCQEWSEAKLPAALAKVTGQAPLLNLNGQRLGDNAVMAIADQVSLCGGHLTTLLVDENRVGDEACATLAEVMRRCPALAFVSLGRNDIGCAGAARIAAALQAGAGALTHLNLEGNHIADEGAAALAAALREHGRVVDLNVAHNALSGSSVVGFVGMPSLEVLHVGGNKLSGQRPFLDGLCAALAASPSLRELLLVGGGQGTLGDDGAVALAAVVGRADLRLTGLSVGGNGIGDDGLFALSQALVRNKHLTRLSVEQNTFTDAGAKVLAEVLRCREAPLRSLDVRGVPLSSAVIDELTALPVTVEFSNASAPSRAVGSVGGKARTWYGWCSSCFSHEEHKAVGARSVSRCVHECGGCGEFGVRCVRPGCGDMASYHQLGSAYFCAVHSGVIRRWGALPEPKVRWCSWCLSLTEHRLVKMHGWRRSVHKCDGCGRRTLDCSSCAVAMARGHEGRWDDSWCLKCDGLLKRWEAEEGVSRKIVGDTHLSGWCSWCYEKRPHLHEKRSRIARAGLRCLQCRKPTVRCMKCSEGMACGGSVAGSALCARCDQFIGRFGGPTLAHTWEALSEGKRLVYKGQANRTMREDLTRRSNYRGLAQSHGMLRPFLMLCSMGPDARFHTALSLDINLLRCHCFGDSHAEAWHVLSCRRAGVAARAGYSHEALNPFGKGCSWVEVLRRVAEVYQPGLAPAEDASRKVKDAESAAADAAEGVLLSIVCEVALNAIPEKQLSSIAAIVASDDPSIVELLRRLNRVGINDQSAYLYTLWLSLQAGQSGPSPLQTGNLSGVGLMVRDAVMRADGSRTRDRLTGADVVLSAALLPTPLAPVGAAVLACGGLDAALGPDTPTLFSALVDMLNRRLLLAVEGIDVREFC
eukprot:TRINITY_DN27170_c0_g1_i1.p1 TRINITY_DN27170_c0_g1~~TRINITY_DN27170_c0_g1_i1.p1  ORF type:complete len:959 (+),score=298.90 TRINITY_DN27170_c0_g1_i1:61-2877(+)